MMAAQPLSLSSQAGLVSLELIHQNCVNLENSYVKCWLPELNKRNREYEERLDCSSLDVADVVAQYRDKFKDRRGRTREGIPVSAQGASRPIGSQQSYIKYRKCLQLLTVSSWRDSLMSQTVMTPEMMSGLVDLAASLYRPSKERLEAGALTLQATLTCQWTERLHTFSTGRTFEVIKRFYLFLTFNLQDTDRTSEPTAGRPETGGWRRRTRG